MGRVPVEVPSKTLVAGYGLDRGGARWGGNPCPNASAIAANAGGGTPDEQRDRGLARFNEDLFLDGPDVRSVARTALLELPRSERYAGVHQPLLVGTAGWVEWRGQAIRRKKGFSDRAVASLEFVH